MMIDVPPQIIEYKCESQLSSERVSELLINYMSSAEKTRSELALAREASTKIMDERYSKVIKSIFDCSEKIIDFGFYEHSIQSQIEAIKSLDIEFCAYYGEMMLHLELASGYENAAYLAISELSRNEYTRGYEIDDTTARFGLNDEAYLSDYERKQIREEWERTIRDAVSSAQEAERFCDNLYNISDSKKTMAAGAIAGAIAGLQSGTPGGVVISACLCSLANLVVDKNYVYQDMVRCLKKAERLEKHANDLQERLWSDK